MLSYIKSCVSNLLRDTELEELQREARAQLEQNRCIRVQWGYLPQCFIDKIDVAINQYEGKRRKMLGCGRTIILYD